MCACTFTGMYIIQIIKENLSRSVRNVSWCSQFLEALQVAARQLNTGIPRVWFPGTGHSGVEFNQGDIHIYTFDEYWWILMNTDEYWIWIRSFGELMKLMVPRCSNMWWPWWCRRWDGPTIGYQLAFHGDLSSKRNTSTWWIACFFVSIIYVEI